MHKFIRIQRVLRSFESTTVREDFLSGRFGVPEANEETLECLDYFRDALVPQPRTKFRDLDHSESMMCGTTKVFMRLVNRCASYPWDAERGGLPVKKSYGEWSVYFSLLYSSTVWTRHDDADGRLSRDTTYHEEPISPSRRCPSVASHRRDVTTSESANLRAREPKKLFSKVE